MDWKHFTFNEMTRSATAKQYGIDNTPSEDVVSNLNDLVVNVLDPLREAWGKPILVSSGYRCKRLNTIVGGVKNSQHIKGQAADITPLDYSLINKFIAFAKEWCLKNEFDQCIIETSKKTGGKWIHISYNKENNRKKVFSLWA